MKRHSGLHGFPGGGKLRPESSAQSGRSAAIIVRPIKDQHEVSQRFPCAPEAWELLMVPGRPIAVRWLGSGCCEADEGPSWGTTANPVLSRAGENGGLRPETFCAARSLYNGSCVGR